MAGYFFETAAIACVECIEHVLQQIKSSNLPNISCVGNMASFRALVVLTSLLPFSASFSSAGIQRMPVGRDSSKRLSLDSNSRLFFIADDQRAPCYFGPVFIRYGGEEEVGV